MNVKNIVLQNSMMMNIINLLNGTFIKLNVSLQNKSINLFQKQYLTDHKLLNGSISYNMHSFLVDNTDLKPPALLHLVALLLAIWQEEHVLYKLIDIME